FRSSPALYRSATPVPRRRRRTRGRRPTAAGSGAVLSMNGAYLSPLPSPLLPMSYLSPLSFSYLIAFLSGGLPSVRESLLARASPRHPPQPPPARQGGRASSRTDRSLRTRRAEPRRSTASSH